MKGIWFDNVHSYDDLNLVLSKVEISPAVPKTNYVDVPGANGSLDLTEALGEVKFQDRKCQFTFAVLPSDDFEKKKTQVSNLLNGRKCNIILDKDPNYFWSGRCSVDSYASDKNLHQIVVGATVAPYKLKKTQTVVTVPSGTSVTRTLKNGRKSVVPTITTTAEAKIVFNGNSYTLGVGTHAVLNIELKYGDNQIKVTSTAPVIFTYQEGDL